jgi:tRNA(Ile)-lysidine synthase
MDFSKSIKSSIVNNKLIKKGERVGVAVSGGVDSMCLLYAFLKLKNEFDLSLFALHFEHGIRGEDSVNDARFIKETCETLEIEYVMGKGDVPKIAEEKKQSIETAARNARYSFFESATKKYKLDKIALAHHLDDQAETIILNLVRGSGTKGLTAMKDFRKPNYIRPMLSILKTDILEYAEKENIPYRIDKTNDDINFSRNKIRHNVLKELKEINENAALNLKRSSDIVKDDDDFLDTFVDEEFDKRVKIIDGEVVISLLNWDKTHVAIKRRLIRKALEQHFSLIDVEFIHIEYIIDITQGLSGKRIEIGGGINASKAYEILYIFKKEKKEKIYKALLVKDNISFSINGYEFLTSILEKPKLCKASEVFDIEKLKDIVFRNAMPDDYIYPLGMNGKKKLTDYFCDIKIPLHKRQKVLLLAKGNEIVWVVGYGISDNFKLSEDTKKAFRISYNSRMIE